MPMKRMSEASVIKKAVRIAVGDRAVVAEAREASPEEKAAQETVAKLQEKMRQLEEEKEKAVEERLEALEEAERLAEKNFEKQLASLEESKRDTVKALEEKLEKLKMQKEETETELDTRITPLRHAREVVKKGIPAKPVKEDTITKLEEKLSDLERSKEDALKDLQKAIESLEKRKSDIKTPRKRKADIKAPPKKRIITESEKSGGLSLTSCIAIAMENHLPLKISKKQLRLAEMRLTEAGRDLGPTVTATWELTDGRVSGKYYDGQKIAVEGKQPLFYGGELVFSVRQAKVNLEIVKNDYDRLKNDLILQVKKAYYSLDKSEKALEIQKKLRSRAKKLYDVTKAGFDAGVISEVEFLKVSSQYNQADFQATSAKEDISIANLILQQAMNQDAEIRIIPVAEPRIIALGLKDCFDLAYLNRPEIKISRLSIEHYEYEKKIMEARAHWPRVDLLGMYGNMSEDFISKDQDPANKPRTLGPEYYVGAKASVPLWGNTLGYSFTKEEWQPIVRTRQATKSNTHAFSISFLNKLEDFSALEESDLEYMRSQDDMDKRKQEITLEVKETFFKYKKALFLMNVSESKVEFQAKQTRITDIRRELGEAQYSDVIEEMIKLAEEEYAYLQAISDYYVAIASLNKAVGLDDHFEV
jgi:outer membrane protein TolC